MKKIMLAVVVLILSFSVFADTYVKGYYKKNGTYVAPHYRSSPNSYTYDNYSAKGNTNPYTGKQGTQSNYPNNIYKPYSVYKPYVYNPQ